MNSEVKAHSRSQKKGNCAAHRSPTKNGVLILSQIAKVWGKNNAVVFRGLPSHGSHQLAGTNALAFYARDHAQIIVLTEKLLDPNVMMKCIAFCIRCIIAGPPASFFPPDLLLLLEANQTHSTDNWVCKR